jgi:hypothetical protein
MEVAAFQAAFQKDIQNKIVSEQYTNCKCCKQKTIPIFRVIRRTHTPRFCQYCNCLSNCCKISLCTRLQERIEAKSHIPCWECGYYYLPQL